MKKVLLAVCLTVMMMFVVAPGVQADILTFFITSDHVTGGAGTPPFGTVKLETNGAGGVDFTVTLFDGSLFVNTGASNFQNFLFNGIGVAAADVTGTGAFAGLLTSTLFNPAETADGTGLWNLGVVKTGQAIGGGAGYVGPLTFTVANAVLSDLTNPNNLGNIFAIDILSGQTGFTGLVDVSTPPVVPEPSTLLLLGGGLVGLAVYGRKAFKR